MTNSSSVSSRYLQYWWDRRSQINPENVSGKYYQVFYDRWRRYIQVDTYDKEHVLTGWVEFKWKGILLERSTSYLPNGEIKFYTIYHRNWYGWVLRIERHFPDGTISLIEVE